MVIFTGAEAIEAVRLTEPGGNMHDECSGSPEQANVTVCGNAIGELTFIEIALVVCPATTVSELGDGALNESICAALITVCVSVVDTLAEKLESLPYEAVTECDPAGRLAVLNVATPSVKVPMPSDVLPSLNVTVPDGVPDPGAVAVTVEVNVTDAPVAEGFNDETTEVLVAALFTTCDSAGDDVLPLKLESPLYCAVIECVPAVSVLDCNVATAAESVIVEPICVVPSKNFTVPLGTAVPDAG